MRFRIRFLDDQGVWVAAEYNQDWRALEHAEFLATQWPDRIVWLETATWEPAS